MTHLSWKRIENLLAYQGEPIKVLVTGEVTQISGNMMIIDDSTGLLPIYFDKAAANWINQVVRVGGTFSGGALHAEFATMVDEKWIDFHVNHPLCGERLTNAIKMSASEGKEIHVETIHMEDIGEQVTKKKQVIVKNNSEVIIDMVRELDGGDGTLVQDVVGKVKDFDADGVIQGLIESGDLFLVKPGRVKVLE